MPKLQLLSPAPDRCPHCAVQHPPEDPHDATSLFYGVWFKQQHGRSPTWADAIDHCDERTKALWTEGLANAGIDQKNGIQAPSF